MFIAGLFALAAKEMAGLVESFGATGGDHAGGTWVEATEVSRYRAAAASMEVAMGQHGWDGSWFRRAYDYYGDPIGSHLNREGQIFIEPQGMCVMGGAGLDDGRARQALDSVRAKLATPHGIVLLQPAYTRYHLELGEISTYPPGYKENASVFCHTNPWVMIAEAMLGNGDAAFDYYQRINPSAREVHRAEPYVYAQTIAGADAPSHGEAKNSWLTGTAAWNFVAITQWILGIRPEFSGLRVDPVIPASWPGFSATRVFRGATYRTKVSRPAGPVHGNAAPGSATPGDAAQWRRTAGPATAGPATAGPATAGPARTGGAGERDDGTAETVTSGQGRSVRVGYLVVDGVRVEGNVVPIAPSGATVNVEVLFGGDLVTGGC